MANLDIQMQDHQGNIIHPQTNAKVVEYKGSNVSSAIDSLSNRKELFIQDIEPSSDGLWIDMSDEIIEETGKNPMLEEIKKYIKESMIPSRNVLINGYFQVWQRGISFENIGTTNTYLADRWKCVLSTTSTITMVKKEVGCKLSMSKVLSHIESTIEEYALYKGKKVTISINVPNLRSGTLKLYINNGISNISQMSITNAGVYNITTDIPTNSTALKIIVEAGSDLVDCDLKYVKLELGAIPTLCASRSFAEELALCQRYYVNCDLEKHYPSFTGIMGTYRGSMIFPSTMRAIPQITTTPCEGSTISVVESISLHGFVYGGDNANSMLKSYTADAEIY